MREARTLLAEAARVYDSEPGLAAAARSAAGDGFAGGARWMREALGRVRRGRPRRARVVRARACSSARAHGNGAAVIARCRVQIRIERIVTGRDVSARLLYASDLHLGWPWTRHVPRTLLDVLGEVRPDVLLLGG